MQPEDKQGDWQFRQEEANAQPAALQPEPSPQTPSEPVQWTASEYIARHKDAGWYLAIVASFAVLCALIYLLTHDLISIISIAVVVLLFLVVSGKKPQQRSYAVDQYGITIGEKFYPYELFKSFAVSYEGAIGCVTFIPLKRFMPELSIYYAPDDENRILDTLTSSLPNDQRSERSVDRLMKRLHF